MASSSFCKEDVTQLWHLENLRLWSIDFVTEQRWCWLPWHALVLTLRRIGWTFTDDTISRLSLSVWDTVLEIPKIQIGSQVLP